MRAHLLVKNEALGKETEFV